MKPSRVFWIVSLLVILAIIYFVFDPANSTYFPKCPFLSLTGFQCPGCGSQRAIHQLLNGNLIQAFHYNPLLVIILPYVFLLLLLEIGTLKKRFAGLHRMLYHHRLIQFIFIGIVGFWIFRNL